VIRRHRQPGFLPLHTVRYTRFAAGDAGTAA
jgi:hypothetical protein